MNPNYTCPYYNIPWCYAMPAQWPPRQNWGNWQPYAYAVPFPARNDENTLREWRDYGGQPFVVDIEEAAEQNGNYRTALWTGKHLQVTLMSIDPGGDIGLEVHPGVDQFIRIEHGRGVVQMGERKDHLHLTRYVSEDDAIMIPAGTWHNVINIGRDPLKLYTIYAPPEHPFGTVHRTKADAAAAEQR